MAEVISGKDLSKKLRKEMKKEIRGFSAEGRRVPCLAVILVGDNPASLSYVKGKEKACASIGMESRKIHLPADIPQKELEDIVRKCSADDSIDGILVQLPLPKGLNKTKVIMCIDPDKDVDGLHPMNVGRFMSGMRSFVPCTPLGIMEILKEMNCDPMGRRAVVIGRSALVGTPVARLLQNAGATVTVCHSKTKKMKEVTKEADILVAAVGKAEMIGAEYIKEGAYVVDVGINRTEDGRLTGDVKFEEACEKAAAVTPVPGGVGPMTICMLLRNTLDSYKRRSH